MGRKAGATRIKRSRAPPFWRIPRKRLRFVYRVRPGPHPKDRAYPLAVLVRDVLGLVGTAREAEAVIKEGRIKVDGVVRREPGFPVGLMDTISVEATGTHYRLLPADQGGLRAVPIPAEEASVKPLAVKRKTTVRGGLVQLGFHDGRTMVLRQARGDVGVGDTVLVNLATGEAAKILPLTKGSLALLTRGGYGGSLARIVSVTPGSISSPAMVEVELDSRRVTVPKDSVFVIGDGAPVVTVPQTAGTSA
jgi:small subunit ribosomal protein S4e